MVLTANKYYKNFEDNLSFKKTSILKDILKKNHEKQLF
mgnify:CR=1 FL=1